MPTMLNNLLDAVRAIGVGNINHAALYRYRKAWAEARWADPTHPRRGLDLWYAFRRHLTRDHPAWPAHWQSPGPVQAIDYTPRGALLTAEHATIEIVFFAADLVRVRVLPRTQHPAPEPLPYAIAKPLEEWPAPALETIEGDSAFSLRSEALTVGVQLDSAQVFFADPAGHLLRVDVDTAWGRKGALRQRTSLAEGERLFGLGERATPGNRRGRKHILWNVDPAGYTNDDDPIDLNIPVYVTIGKHSSSLVFYENPYYAEFDLGETVPNVADHRFAGGELRYYFAAGPVPTLLERYTELTGRHDLPPLWMLGYQQCRWSYVPAARVRKLAQDFREHDVPCDAIYLDIDYMEGFRCFTWDRERFPDLPRLAADLREQGIKLITIIDPGIKKDPAYGVYRSGVAGGHFCKLPDGKVFHAPVWPGLSAFPDFTDPEARAWWGEQYRPLVEAGIAGFWNDMNEPSAFASGGDKTLPGPVRHSLEGRGGDHREAHNLYGMQMVRATREGLLRLRPDARPVVITRAGWAGVQRHSLSWTGDNESTWASLRLSVPLVLGLGLSGLGFTGPDTGGFIGEADGELFTRWVQLATFMPLFRAHTVINTPDQEPWSYGEPYLSINRRFIQLRYELLPYLYTAVWQLTTRGWPVVRPLWWRDQENAALWDVDDAFLCGDALLVAPVGEPGVTAREVTLPAGAWYDFWTNHVGVGASLCARPYPAPLETIPLFVRAGTVLPLGEIGPSVEQRPDKFLRLHVYPLTEDGEAVSWLYEDAGEGFGAQRVSRFVMRRAGDRFEIIWERDGDYHPPYEHIALTLNGLPRMPQAVLADGKPYRPVSGDPVLHTALVGLPPFEKLEIVL